MMLKPNVKIILSASLLSSLKAGNMLTVPLNHFLFFQLFMYNNFGSGALTMLIGGIVVMTCFLVIIATCRLVSNYTGSFINISNFVFVIQSNNIELVNYNTGWPKSNYQHATLLNNSRNSYQKCSKNLENIDMGQT